MEPELSDSLWAATAPSGVPTPPLEGERRCDVAVVGGGYTGLSAALRLSEGGADAVVLEAREPGWGASGRNGGQVIPGLKYDPDELVALHGAKRAEVMIGASEAAADLVFALIEKHAIACDAARSGWIQPAHSTDRLPTLRRRFEQWARRGADVAWLERAELADALGTDAYHGGWLDRRAGSVQPLAYARGLARAARAAGATICGGSPVTALARFDDGWRVQTPRGAVVADQVLLCTNGYTGGLWPRLRETIVPVYSVQLATSPLSENVRRSILPGGQTTSDTRRVLSYFRLDGQGRLLMGGGGSAYGGSIARLAAGLKRRVAELFPQIAEPRFEHVWGGRVALTMDHLPHRHVLGPGLQAGLGYNGRGVAMATMMGKVLADHALARPKPEHDFPASMPRPIPLHALRGFAVTATRMYYRFRDRLDA
jgi:glycine/D-amino acid oxidase-like deaminating enzyme